MDVGCVGVACTDNMHAGRENLSLRNFDLAMICMLEYILQYCLGTGAQYQTVVKKASWQWMLLRWTCSYAQLLTTKVRTVNRTQKRMECAPK